MWMPKLGMFGRIVLAILGGVALGFLPMHTGTGDTAGLRILKTFNVLFAQVLNGTGTHPAKCL